MDAKAVADKYISRGGGSPEPTPQDVSKDIMDLGNFILWHNPRDMHACVYPDQAFAAMCRLLNVEQHVLRSILKPEG